MCLEIICEMFEREDRFRMLEWAAAGYIGNFRI